MTAVPLLLGHLVEHAVLGDAGVVDQDFDRAEIGFDLGDARDAGVIVGHVPFVDVDAGFGVESLGGFVIAGVAGRDLVAGAFQGLGNGGADTARAAGDDCNSRHVSSLNYVGLRIQRRR